MRNLVWFTLAIAAGCAGGGSDETPDAAGDVARVPDAPLDTSPQPIPPVLPADTSLGRPATKVDTLGLEGMPERMEFRLYRAPLPPPLSFTTYVPADILVEETGPADARTVRFVANFAGRRRDDAALSFSALSAGTTPAEARATVRAVAESRGLQERRQDAPQRFDWALAEHGFMYDCGAEQGCQIGAVALAEHAGRFFQILLEYPEGFAEGFGPRAHRILKELRWVDTGGGLTRR